jgi:hypothetical protein
MTSDPKECRKHALRCAELALAARTLQLKSMFLELSKNWENLAIQIEGGGFASLQNLRILARTSGSPLIRLAGFGEIVRRETPFTARHVQRANGLRLHTTRNGNGNGGHDQINQDMEGLHLVIRRQCNACSSRGEYGTTRTDCRHPNAAHGDI